MKILDNKAVHQNNIRSNFIGDHVLLEETVRIPSQSTEVEKCVIFSSNELGKFIPHLLTTVPNLSTTLCW